MIVLRAMAFHFSGHQKKNNLGQMPAEKEVESQPRHSDWQVPRDEHHQEAFGPSSISAPSRGRPARREHGHSSRPANPPLADRHQQRSPSPSPRSPSSTRTATDAGTNPSVPQGIGGKAAPSPSLIPSGVVFGIKGGGSGSRGSRWPVDAHSDDGLREERCQLPDEVPGDALDSASQLQHSVPNWPRQSHQRFEGSGQWASPLFQLALEASKVEKLTGFLEDFEEFEHQWHAYVELMRSVCSTPERLVLTALRSYLDEPSAAILDRKLGANPNLFYEEFWQELRTRFDGDMLPIHRFNWRTVKLKMAGHAPTLQEWDLFCAQYTTRRQLVYDWSDSEDRELVFSQVPRQFLKGIVEETRVRRKTLHWVRVEYPVGLAPQEVQREFELPLHRSLLDCVFHRHSLVVKCASELEKLELLQFHGGTIEGKLLKVRLAHFHMSGDDMLEHVREELLLVDELQRLRLSLGCLTAEKGDLTPKSSESQSLTPQGGNKQKRREWWKNHLKRSQSFAQGTSRATVSEGSV